MHKIMQDKSGRILSHQFLQYNPYGIRLEQKWTLLTWPIWVQRIFHRVLTSISKNVDIVAKKLTIKLVADGVRQLHTYIVIGFILATFMEA